MLIPTLCLQGEGAGHCIELQVPAEPSPGWGQRLLGTGPGHRAEAKVWQVRVDATVLFQTVISRTEVPSKSTGAGSECKGPTPVLKGSTGQMGSLAEPATSEVRRNINNPWQQLISSYWSFCCLNSDLPQINNANIKQTNKKANLDMATLNVAQFLCCHSAGEKFSSPFRAY